ncbi:hypothetical protein ACSN7Q_001656 [Flavobacterium psychrophilum]
MNFISGATGSFLGFTELAPNVTTQDLPTDGNSLVTAIVTIVGGLVTTLLTSLLKKWLGKSKNADE